MSKTIQEWINDARIANAHHNTSPKVHGRIKRERLIEDKAQRFVRQNYEVIGNCHRVQVDGRWYETDKAGASRMLTAAWERLHE